MDGAMEGHGDIGPGPSRKHRHVRGREARQDNPHRKRDHPHRRRDIQPPPPPCADRYRVEKALEKGGIRRYFISGVAEGSTSSGGW